MTREYYYLDTNYLFAYLAHRHAEYFKRVDIDREQSLRANRVITHLTPSKIKVSVFVLAESVMQLREKEIDIGTVILHGDFETAMLRREDINKFIKALEMLIENKSLEEMDSIIVAHAISSSECRGLLTFDNRLINNRTINDTNRAINDSKGIVITSDPTTLS
jgi:predicted nucleic acid-binding protein